MRGAHQSRAGAAVPHSEVTWHSRKGRAPLAPRSPRAPRSLRTGVGRPGRLAPPSGAAAASGATPPGRPVATNVPPLLGVPGGRPRPHPGLPARRTPRGLSSQGPSGPQACPGPTAPAPGGGSHALGCCPLRVHPPSRHRHVLPRLRPPGRAAGTARPAPSSLAASSRAPPPRRRLPAAPLGVPVMSPECGAADRGSCRTRPGQEVPDSPPLVSAAPCGHLRQEPVPE